MNSSCNDSEISSGGELSASRCTSSCGERSSVSELDLSCSTSDSEDLSKSTNAPNEAKTEEVKPNVEAEKSGDVKSDAKSDENKPSNDSNNNVSEQPATSQTTLVKTESKRRSILLSNQVTKQSKSISTAAPKLLLPSRDVVDGYECCPKSTEKMVKFFTYFLREDVEYKTLSISNNTTSRQVIAILLDKVSFRLLLN